MMLFLMLLSVGGCAKNRAGDYCDIASPIYFDSDLSVNQTPKDIRRQILIMNETLKDLCIR